MTSPSPKAHKYFDLITNGLGKMHRVREVRRGTLACGIKGLHGIRGSASSTPYDLIVVGHDAKDCVRLSADAANDVRNDVLMKFTIGDSRIHTFPLNGGGEGALLKGRLVSCERFNPSPATSEYTLTTRGIGYINFVRAGSEECQPSLLCGVSALVGREDEIAKVSFDVNVIDDRLKALVREYAPYVEARHDVLVGFTLVGAQIHSFPCGGDRSHELGYAVRSQLSEVSFVTVDGKRVYNAPRNSNDGAATSSEHADHQSEESCAA